ncbi:MAG: hypothetical protein K2O04_06030 [Clostridiales bacterium]|nr:hypothetical protein [Clostridiales bacterium]
MEKKYNPMEYNNVKKCQICGHLTFMDDYGNIDKCPNCGWIGCTQNTLMEKWHGISYPMLVPLSRAREQYKSGQKFKATFEDFINGLNWYKEMLFWHNNKYFAVYYRQEGISLESRDMEQMYKDVDEFCDKANIEGRLLKDIWDEVVHPCFMYCGEEHDYDFPPED